MNLFLKIFLWFMAAIALMIGTVIFLNWTVQTEPVVSRWQTSVRNQTNIYAATAAQIYQTQGEAGLREFLQRVKDGNTATEIDVLDRDGKLRLGENVDISKFGELVPQAFSTGTVQMTLSDPDTALTAKSFTLLVVRRDEVGLGAAAGAGHVRRIVAAVSAAGCSVFDSPGRLLRACEISLLADREDQAGD